MINAVIYIHGMGGSAAESAHYEQLFPEYDVIGIEYAGNTPREVCPMIREKTEAVKKTHDTVILIASSIGAYYSMQAGIDRMIRRAYFISPLIDMEKMINGMMTSSGISEEELKEKGTVHTASGGDLSWEYLCYAREHPSFWNAPAEILYGSEDRLISLEEVRSFAERCDAGLTVMAGGEHWFHTEEQMLFLDEWIRRSTRQEREFAS